VRDMGHETLPPYDRGLTRAAKATWRPFRLCQVELCQVEHAVGALAGKVGC